MIRAARRLAALMAWILVSTQVLAQVLSPNPADLGLIRKDGGVGALAVDASGYVYVGGSFETPYGEQRNLVRLNPDGTLDTAWRPNPDSQVNALAIDGDRLYVGGFFTSIGGQPRKKFAAIDLGTGTVAAWDPALETGTGWVYAIAASGGTVWVSGNWQGTSAGDYLALFVGDARIALPAAVAPSSRVWALATNGSTLYLGGEFTQMGATPRSYLAAIDVATRVLLPWNPGADQQVAKLALGGSDVFAAGSFSQLGGQARRRLGAVDASTGVVTGWDPSPDAAGSVYALHVDGSSVYVGGSFSTIAGQPRSGVAAFALSTGAIESFAPSMSSPSAQSLLRVGSALYYGGGGFALPSGTRHAGLAAFPLAGGSPVRDYCLGQLGNVRSVAMDSGGGTLIGGRWDCAGVPATANLARLAADGSLDPSWTVAADGNVETIAVTGSTAYLGGSFRNLGGSARNFAAAVSTSGSGVLPWNPAPDGNVQTIKAVGGEVWLGGFFGSVGGGSYARVAVVDATAGLARHWDAAVSGSVVRAIDVVGNSVFIGGSFGVVGGQVRTYVAELDATTAGVSPWSPLLNQYVQALTVVGNTVYVSGAFTTVNGEPRARLAAIDRATGQATFWSPVVNQMPLAFRLAGETLIMAGQFTRIDGQISDYLAMIDAETNDVALWNPVMNVGPLGVAGLSGFDVSGIRLIAGGSSFTAVDGERRSGIAAFDVTRTLTPVGGGNQIAATGAAFGAPLSVSVTDGIGFPVIGATVRFELLASGPSGTFPGGLTVAKGAADASGIASSPPITANASAGSYTVAATTAFGAGPISFVLTNGGGGPASIAPSGASTPQTTYCTTAFARPLEALVRDAGGSPLAGIPVTFQFPASGTAGPFPTMAQTLVIATDATGTARTPPIVGGSLPGPLIVEASVVGVAAPAAFALTVTCPIQMRYSFAGGAAQSALAGTPFASPLKVLVRDFSNNPVSGAWVRFQVRPGTGGASGTFAGGAAVADALTLSDGIATSPILTANATAGVWDVRTADLFAAGMYMPDLTFALANNSSAPASIVPTGGTPQSTVVTTTYSQPLTARVLDAASVPVLGVQVTFSLPASGASGTFEPSGSTTATVATNDTGHAVSPTIRANSAIGAYTATATAAGAGTASFLLTNNAAGQFYIVPGGGDLQVATVGQPYSRPLTACAVDDAANRITGIQVEFRMPTAGASASFAGGATSELRTTGGDGCATSPAFTANGIAGAFVVVADAGGAEGAANYTLTNAGVATSIQAATGTPQSQFVNGGYAQLLRAIVRDGSGQGVPGASVTFTAPASSASVTFSGGGASYTTLTDGQGIATALGTSANAVAGMVSVQAATAGVGGSAHFDLANLAAEGVIAVAAGSQHTCALSASGDVKCWGSDGLGQLGRGSSGGVFGTPQDVVALGAPIVAIAAGLNHTCALTSAGGVKCWGDNNMGALGRGNVGGDSASPGDVIGLTSGAVAIGAGGQFTCAVMANGGVRCWGANYAGQLGRGSTGTADGTPQDVVGMASGTVFIATGYYHACAVTAIGGLRCWGNNLDGQLGRGVIGPADGTPQDVVGMSGGVAAVSAGTGSTCAVTSGGGVKCWGYNGSGQLGRGSSGPTDANPQDVLGLTSGVLAVRVGGSFACVLTVGGAVKCWGANSSGELGRFVAADFDAVPQVVPGASAGVASIGVGPNHACALSSNGGLKCWGNSLALGRGADPGFATVPREVSGLVNSAIGLGAGAYISCAVGADDGARCWGDNATGQLGRGATGGRDPQPQGVAGLASGVAAIGGGISHACALTTTGGVKCWGNNSSGELGRGTTGLPDATPQVVSTLASDVAALAVGGVHACVVTTGRGVRCWGNNGTGQLGRGNVGGWVSAPQDAPGLTSGVAAVAAGYGHTCALTTTGGVKCWGNNSQGELGRGTIGEPDGTPQDVSGLSTGVLALGAGAYHTCALLATGRVKCWGRNYGGELGRGYVGGTDGSPQLVAGIAGGVNAIAAGWIHTCVVMANGALACWGYDGYGQLGRGTAGNGDGTPQNVAGLTSGVLAASTGGAFHTCARMADGVRCWGRNSEGQLADGNYARSAKEVLGVSSAALAVGPAGGTPQSAPMGLSEILCVRHIVAERSLYASQDQRDEGRRAGAAGEQGVA